MRRLEFACVKAITLHTKTADLKVLLLRKKIWRLLKNENNLVQIWNANILAWTQERDTKS